jgi:DNA polymerase-3 subunit gamma/tau
MKPGGRPPCGGGRTVLRHRTYGAQWWGACASTWGSGVGAGRAARSRPHPLPTVAAARTPRPPPLPGHVLAGRRRPRQADPPPRAPSGRARNADVMGVPCACSPSPARAKPSRRAHASFTPTPEDGDFWHHGAATGATARPSRRWCANWRCSRSSWARDTDQWMLRIERETLNQPSSREKLTHRAGRHRPRGQAWPSRSAAWSTARRAASRPRGGERQRVAEEIILNDPFVQALMQRDFGAKIVPGASSRFDRRPLVPISYLSPTREDHTCSTKDNSPA